MDRIRIALLGCGDVAQRYYLPELHRLADRIELAAVCDVQEDRARAVAARYDARAWFSDYARMLAESEVQLIVNLTPIGRHAETTRAALRAGKHVYTEKPVATSVQEAEQLRDEARQRGLILSCAPGVVLFPQVRQAQELLAAGTIGPVYSARAHAHGGVPPWPGFISDPSPYFAPGTGPAVDVGVYALHALTGLLGPVQRVGAMTARAQHRFTIVEGPVRGREVPVQVDDNWHLLLDFGGARLASIEATNCVQGTRAPQLELYGLQGTLAVHSLLDVGAPLEVLHDGVWTPVEVTGAGPQAGIDLLVGLAHTVDCVQQGRAPTTSPEHAIHVVDIIEQAARSSLEGQMLAVGSSFQPVMQGS